MNSKYVSISLASKYFGLHPNTLRKRARLDEIEHYRTAGGRKSVKIGDTTINRDVNGARGIFLRALVDTPWLSDGLAK